MTGQWFGQWNGSIAGEWWGADISPPPSETVNGGSGGRVRLSPIEIRRRRLLAQARAEDEFLIRFLPKIIAGVADG